MTVAAAPIRLWRTRLDEPHLSAFASALARVAPRTYVLHLSGELGAGKTTFARAFIRALLPRTRVKSPTFALVEPYGLAEGGSIYHIDLYRVSDASELEALGIRELAAPGNGILIEWPERARAELPGPDLEIAFAHAGDERRVEVRACSAAGNGWLATLAAGAA